jgi:hypothetical protein
LAGVFLAILILFWGLPSGVYGGCLLARPDLVNITRFVSPFEALLCALDGDSVSGWWNILFNVGLGLSLLAAACVAVPWLAREKETGFMRATVRRRGDRPATGNPVAWKEGVASLTMRMRWLLAGLLVATCFFAAHYLVDTRMVKELFEDRVDDPVVVAARVTGVLSLLIIIIGTVVASATAYSREKRTRALELLLISELSETDVVLGKMWHCVRSSRPWF